MCLSSRLIECVSQRESQSLFAFQRKHSGSSSSSSDNDVPATSSVVTPSSSKKKKKHKKQEEAVSIIALTCFVFLSSFYALVSNSFNRHSYIWIVVCLAELL